MGVWLAVGSIFWVVFVDGFYLTLLVTSVFTVRNYVRTTHRIPLGLFKTAPMIPPMSVIVPAYNEGITIVESVHALLRLQYPEHEVVIVNDGSSDNTLAVLIEAFALLPISREAIRQDVPCDSIRQIYRNPAVPKLWVIDKPNGGKGAALNAGINLSHYPLLCTIDADSLLEPSALLRIVRTYLQDPDRTVAIGGMIRIANSCRIYQGRVKTVRAPRKLLPAIQTVEYIKTFIGGRSAWSSFNGLAIISGAFGVFRRDMVVAVGGYSLAKPGEDMEIVLRIHVHCRAHRIPYRITFCPDAVCWTQAPETFRVLRSQRTRWGRGNLRNIKNFLFVLFRPKYGTLGMISLPYLVLVELLSPYVMIIGAISLIVLLILHHDVDRVVITLLSLGFVFDVFIGLGAMVLDDRAFHRYRMRDLLRLSLHLLHMPLWYYFLSAYWRITGHIQLVRGHNQWGTMTRQSWHV